MRPAQVLKFYLTHSTVERVGDELLGSGRSTGGQHFEVEPVGDLQVVGTKLHGHGNIVVAHTLQAVATFVKDQTTMYW